MQNDVNYYIATILDSSEMSDFKTVTTDKNVQVRIAKNKDGQLKVQSILFPKDQYNFNSANLSAHILEPLYR